MSSWIRSLDYTLLAASLSIWTALSPQVAWAQSQFTQRVDSLLFCEQDIDFWEISQPYTIQNGDTFSSIADRIGMPYDDFVMIWSFVNPGKDINATIQVGEVFYIPKYDEVSRLRIEYYKTQIIAQNNFETANELFETWNIDELKQLFWFDITPRLPINLGIKRANDVLLDMITQWYRIWPRSALPELENTAACLHVIKQFLKYAVWFDASVPEAFFEAIRLEGQSAWIFPQKLEEIGYARLYDLRDLFSHSFPSTRIAISEENSTAYRQWVLEQLRYLQTPEAISAFIPTLYQGTGFAWEVFAGQERNSHMFFNLGVGRTNTFSALSVQGIEGNLWDQGMSLKDFLVFLIKDYGQISRYQALSQENIIDALHLLWEQAEIYIDGARIDISQNSQDWEKMIYPTTTVQIGGAMLMDGFQITPGLGDTRYIEARLVPAWTVYLWALLPSWRWIFFPTSVLSVPDAILSSTPEGRLWEISNEIDIFLFFDLKEGESAKVSYMELLAQEMFTLSFEELSETQQAQVEQRYSLHSLGLQILWYHTLWWTDWTPGSTNINAPIPFLSLKTEAEIGELQTIYDTYMRERKKDFFNSLILECSQGNPQYLDFLQVIVFPGDTTADILYQLEYQLQMRWSTMLHMLADFDRIQKDILLEKLFWLEVRSWNIQAGESTFLDYSLLESTIEDIAKQSYLDLPVDITDADTAILNLLIHTQSLQDIFVFLLLNESYININTSQTENIDDALWAQDIQKYLSRKNLKRIYRWLDENNHLSTLEALQSFLEEEYHDEASHWVNLILSLPTEWPRSYGDFQLRFDNLDNPELALNDWPTSDDLQEAVDLILADDSVFWDILETARQEYPREFYSDLSAVQEIQDELQASTPNPQRISILLQSILQLNDESNRYLIGKILSAALLKSKVLGHSERVIGQLVQAWEDIQVWEDIQERIARMILLANNQWEGDELKVMFDNYLYRYFSSLDISWLPTFWQSQGISSQIIINSDIFYNHMDIYLENITLSDFSFSQREALEKIADRTGDTSQEIYHFMSDSGIRELYESQGLESSFLPTLQELNNRNSSFHRVFTYTDTYYLRDRVVEWERDMNDFRWVFLLSLLWAYYVLNTTAGVSNIIWKTMIVPSLRASSIILFSLIASVKKRRKQYKEKKFEKLLQRSYSEKWLKKYLEERKNPQNLVLDGKNVDQYRDGYYKIEGEEWITIFEQHDSGLILTNEERYPLSKDYKNGNYSFVDSTTPIDRVTQIIRDHAKKLLLNHKTPLLLTPEMRVKESQRFELAAAE
jgi:hypothetical protein